MRTDNGDPLEPLINPTKYKSGLGMQESVETGLHLSYYLLLFINLTKKREKVPKKRKEGYIRVLVHSKIKKGSLSHHLTETHILLEPLLQYPLYESLRTH